MRRGYGELAAVALISGITAGAILTTAGALILPGIIADHARYQLACTDQDSGVLALATPWVEGNATVDGHGQVIESVAHGRTRFTANVPAEATVATRDGTATLTARYTDPSGDTHQCTDATVVGNP